MVSLLHPAAVGYAFRREVVRRGTRSGTYNTNTHQLDGKLLEARYMKPKVFASSPSSKTVVPWFSLALLQ
jgi:hypothetical protein